MTFTTQGDWYGIYDRPAATPGAYEKYAYACYGTNSFPAAIEGAKRARQHFRSQGFNTPVYIVRGPTSTTHCAFGIVTETAGYPVVANLR